MSRDFCPLCYELLEVREVGPCYFCATWPDPQERLLKDRPYKRYRFEAGSEKDLSIVICEGCYLEEIIIGDSGSQPRQLYVEPTFLGLPSKTKLADRLKLRQEIEVPTVCKDKVCLNC